MQERFIDRYLDDGGGSGSHSYMDIPRSNIHMHVPKEEVVRSRRSMKALGRLIELFNNADFEAGKAALLADDLDGFYAVLGITAEEAEEIYDDLQSPLKETLKVELETFQERLPEFLETHPGEHVLIHKEDVGGFFPTQQEGIEAGYARYGNVPFLVQQILEEQPVIEMPLVGR